jgi:butyryl-CoA dehydrogenase
MLYRVAWMKESGVKNFTKEAAMLKLYASEMAHRVCHKALQVHGGYGYMKDYKIERLYRDQRITEIYEGTSEIQRHVIARSLLD